MDEINLKAIIENLLLVSDKPLVIDKLQDFFEKKLKKETLRAALNEIKQDYEKRNIKIQEVAGGYQLATRHEYAEWIRKFHKLDRSARLSKQALDTLSIIAYKQPITRLEIENIRGVDSGGVAKTLLEKNLIRIMGKREVAGRPILYGTSRKFLEYLGLKSINEMPSLEEFKEPDLEIEGELQPAPSQRNIPFENKDPIKNDTDSDQKTENS